MKKKVSKKQVPPIVVLKSNFSAQQIEEIRKSWDEIVQSGNYGRTSIVCSLPHDADIKFIKPISAKRNRFLISPKIQSHTMKPKSDY